MFVCMSHVSVMNILWSEHGCFYKGKNIQALTYKCFPLGVDYGIIEFIPNCRTIKDITDGRKTNKLSADNMSQLMSTCAGSYIAAYILGIRDRHYENVLVTDEGTVFHIDFGYMLGEKVAGLDASKFAITSDLAKLMGKQRYTQFVDICTLCWCILRENCQELLDFARLSFAFLFPIEEVEDFIKNTLLMHEPMEIAKKRIHKKLHQAPKKWNTKMKNFAHSVAQSRSRGNSTTKQTKSIGNSNAKQRQSLLSTAAASANKLQKLLQRKKIN